MAFTASTAERNQQANDLASRLATVRILTSGGTTIADIPLAGFGAAVNGTITANPTAEVTAVAGTAATVSLLDSGGSVRLTGTVTSTAGNGDMKLDTVTIAAGQPIRITSMTFTVPAQVA